MTKKNKKISNIDTTIICEVPKITPYKTEMRKNIARLLKISADKVNIKGKTTEGLGFCGRKEGIAVLTVVNLY
jgi:2-C-methyl-D-erythritol 2,4-cyclodiphosphate synthase